SPHGAAYYADLYWGTSSNSGNAGWNGNFPWYAQDCTNFVSQALNFGGLPMIHSTNLQNPAAWFMVSANGPWSWGAVGTHSNTWAVSDGSQDSLTDWLGSTSGHGVVEGTYNAS